MRETVEDCSTDFELGYLTIEGTGHDAPAEQFDAVHFRLNEAAAMIAAPFFQMARPSRFVARSTSLRAPFRGHLLSMAARYGEQE